MKKKKGRGHTWYDYHSSGEILEIAIKDGTDARIDWWKVNGKDTNEVRKIFQTIKEKYNMDLFIEVKKEDRDIDWIP